MSLDALRIVIREHGDLTLRQFALIIIDTDAPAPDGVCSGAGDVRCEQEVE